MNSFSRTFARCTGILLICALLAPPMANASSKPLTPEQAHARIHKLGVGSWVGVRLQSGAAFSGKVTSIDQNSFALQRYGEPEPTTVAYGDVVYLEMGVSMGSFTRKPMTPEAVHARLLKRGLGNWVAVQLENGIEFSGRLISIDDNSFGLQLYGDPEVTPVAYGDVVYLQTGTPTAAFWVFTGVMVAAGVVVPLVMVHEMSNNKLQMPTLPAQPVTPIW
jgi:small nuclear ribonucleoprotein (snRNP)-like protein